MGNPPDLEPPGVFTRDVPPPADEAPEQDADVTGGYGDAPGRVLRVAHLPAAFTQQPVRKGGDGLGEALLDGGVGQVSPFAVGLRHREGDERRLVPFGRSVALERNVVRLSADGIGLYLRREGRVDGQLQRPHGAEVSLQVDHSHPGGLEDLLDLLVQDHVGAAEPIDRLLGVSHQKELSGNGPDPAPVRLLGVVRRQQQQDLRLQRVRVLELVDEDVAEVFLEIPPDGRSVPDQVASLDQQVHEVESAQLFLELLIERGHLQQFLPEQGRQVGVGAPYEILQFPKQILPRPDHHRPGQSRSVFSSPARPEEGGPQPAQQTEHPALQAIVVAGPFPLEAPDPGVQVPDRTQFLPKPVLPVGRPVTGVRQLPDPAGQGVQERFPVEALSSPGTPVVAPFHEFPGGRAEPIQRRAEVGSLRDQGPLEGPGQTRRRVGQPCFHPLPKGPPEEAGRLILREFPEIGVDAGLHRPLSKQVRAEGVDGGDAGLLQPRHRPLQIPDLHRIRGLPPSSVQSVPQTQLQFAGRLAGEGDGGDPVDACAAAGQDGHQAPDQLAGLARARRRLHQKADVQGVSDGQPPGGIGRRGSLGTELQGIVHGVTQGRFRS